MLDCTQVPWSESEIRRGLEITARITSAELFISSNISRTIMLLTDLQLGEFGAIELLCHTNCRQVSGGKYKVGPSRASERPTRLIKQCTY